MSPEVFLPEVEVNLLEIMNVLDYIALPGSAHPLLETHGARRQLINLAGCKNMIGGKVT